MKLRRYVFVSPKTSNFESLVTGETETHYKVFNTGVFTLEKDSVNIVSQKDALSDLSKSELLLYAQNLEHTTNGLKEIFNFNQDNVDIRLDEILDTTYNFFTNLLNK